MLIVADCSHIGDRCIHVTIHHCFFDGTCQRHPRLRFGKIHLYNNYTRNWGICAVCASVEAQILSQCTIYEAGQKKMVFKYMPEKAEELYQSWMMEPASHSLKEVLVCIGWHYIPRLPDC
ncbi:hypothetical protein LUZ61_003143 [Rhynchospora tenuis]|uniref:Pectate lyase domain-containing protein n=1 Tax=Rhynchospora tenuis TaxID=198213 RepID=A0AAD5ZKB8_9POAL|nr:hypothetical protein LUZ61_003143 [Rhynchospora tenuis]